MPDPLRPEPARPEPTKLVIAGAGGWGLEALWVARAMNAAGTAQWDILGFADDRSGAAGGEHYGTPVLCSIPAITDMCGRETLVFLAVGDNRVRRDLAASLERQGVRFATLIHPRAELAEDVVVGEGSYVGPFATLAPECKVGRHVMVNIHAIVGHEVAVGDFSQLAPGAVVTGACMLGEGVFVGANASLHPGRRLGDYSVVAGNSFVVADLEPRQTAMGIPARPVFQKK